MPLNLKQQRFVAEYLIDLNATQAAIRAGYSPHTAVVQGSRLLTNAEIRAAVQAGAQSMAKSAEITAEAVTRELGYVGFSRITDYVQWDVDGRPLFRPSEELSDAEARGVLSIKHTRRRFGKDGEEESIELRLHPKVQAIGLLAKRFSEFSDKHEHSGEGGGPIVIQRGTRGLADGGDT